MSTQHDLWPDAARLTDERSEYARTPAWLIDAGLRLLPRDFAPDEVLDLGAGLGDLALACWRRWPAIRVTAVERERDRCEEMRSRFPRWDVVQADATWWAGEVTPWTCPLVVVNPPFSVAIDWITLALPLVAPGGALLAIYPLEHLGGLEHFTGLYADHPPRTVGISPKRPRGQGWDDTRAIIAAVWRRGDDGELLVGPTELVWMEVAPR